MRTKSKHTLNTKKIKKFLEDKKVGKEWLAVEVEVSFNCIRNWLDGDSFPLRDRLARLAKVMGVKEEDLYT